MRIDKKELVAGFGSGIVIGVVVTVAGHLAFDLWWDGKQLNKGRIDIASGQVTATLETKPDGTTEWVFSESENHNPE